MTRVRLLLCALLMVAMLAALTAAAAGARHPERATACSMAFLDNNALLGPETLDQTGVLGRMLRGYRRFGSYTIPRFLARYRDAQGWKYPPDNGFLGPISKQTLTAGEKVDRFGPPTSSFLAPFGTPYAGRAIPPQNLDTYPGDPNCDYYAYAVVKPFAVDSGLIAPWFGQRGRGEQFLTMSKYLPGHPAKASVAWLIAHGYLKQIS